MKGRGILIIVFIVLGMFSCDNNENNVEEMEQIKAVEIALIDSIKASIQSRNPDPGLTLYSHLKNGDYLIKKWDSLMFAIPSGDESEVVVKLALAEWNVEFTSLEFESVEWWKESYLSKEEQQRLLPILLEVENRVDLDGTNSNYKRSEIQMIQLELLLMSQLELAQYFEIESPSYQDILKKCTEYGMLKEKAS